MKALIAFVILPHCFKTLSAAYLSIFSAVWKGLNKSINYTFAKHCWKKRNSSDLFNPVPHTTNFENILAKVENAHYEQVLLLSQYVFKIHLLQMHQNASTSEKLRCHICLVVYWKKLLSGLPWQGDTSGSLLHCHFHWQTYIEVTCTCQSVMLSLTDIYRGDMYVSISHAFTDRHI